MNQKRIEQIQTLLQETALEGWLVYDFQGLNRFAATLLELPAGAHLTRRYFLWIPRKGTAVLIHNSIESGTWRRLTTGLELEMRPCRGHLEMTAELEHLLKPGMKVAAEYSPNGQVPYVSMLDGGTLEWLRSFGIELVSSADLLQEFIKWSEEDLASHRRAVATLIKAKNRGFEFLHHRLQAGETVTEYQTQQEILQVILAGGLETDHPPIVAFGIHASDPHYAPQAQGSSALERGECVLIDLWGQEAGRPHGDITWMGYAGTPDLEFLHAWETVKSARDESARFLRQSFETFVLEGWMVDQCAREIIEKAGYGPYFTHRLGHNLGVQLHGPGANLDDLEVRDTRQLLPGLGFTIEPGIYHPEHGFGIRSEINVFIHENGGPRITTPNQHNLFVLGDEDWTKVIYDGNA